MLVASLLLAAAVIYRMARGEDLFLASGLRVEMMYVIVGLLATVAVLLIVLFVGYLYERFARKSENERADGIVIIGGASSRLPTARSTRTARDFACCLRWTERRKSSGRGNTSRE